MIYNYFQNIKNLLPKAKDNKYDFVICIFLQEIYIKRWNDNYFMVLIQFKNKASFAHQTRILKLNRHQTTLRAISIKIPLKNTTKKHSNSRPLFIFHATHLNIWFHKKKIPFSRPQPFAYIHSAPFLFHAARNRNKLVSIIKPKKGRVVIHKRKVT